MKRHMLVLLLACGALIIAGFLSWKFLVTQHPYTVLSIKSFLFEDNPVHWNGISVNYSYGMHVVYHNSSITIHKWGREGEEGVGIYLKDKPVKYWLDEHQKTEKELTYISSVYDEHNGDRIYITENIKTSNGRYMKRYYLLDLPIFFGYAGPPERLALYQETLNSIDYSRLKKIISCNETTKND